MTALLVALLKADDGIPQALGRISQVDLPKGQLSGLREAVDLLSSMEDVAVVEFTDSDVVRHTLVTRIVRAYEARDEAQGGLFETK